MHQRAFDHILVIMFEIQYRGYVMDNQYMRNLAAQGIELTNSFGVMHPSQTNYIASIAGELCGVNDDSVPTPYLPQQTIVDLIEASPNQLDWRAYMDSYVAGWTPWQAGGVKPVDAYPYVLKHNPFSSFSNIITHQRRWEKIDNEAGFYRDLLNGNFPEYAWFTPNMWNDGHYLEGTTDNDLKGERAPVLVDQQAKWLKSFFAGLNFPGPNSKLPPRTLVVVTYDEADFEATYDSKEKFKYYYDGPNQIYTVLLGDMVEPSKQEEGYNHYSLLKTVEKNFNLDSLGKNDRDANWFQFLWGKQFKWHTSQTTPVGEIRAIQAASYHDQLFVAYITPEGNLKYRTFDGEKLSPAVHLAEHCNHHHLSLAANDQGLMLVYSDEYHHLVVMMYDLQDGWHSTEKPVGGHVEHFSMVGGHVEHFSIVALPNLPDFVLVYEDLQGNLFYLRYIDKRWQKNPEKLCCKCDGQFELVALGATILLIYKVRGTDNMACLSYNTARFNKMLVADSQYAGPYDDATVDAWSPNGFSINHFSSAPSVITPREAEPVVEGYQLDGKLTCATLDGVIHLLHNNPNNNQLVTETFSISGTLTSKFAVSYDPAKSTTTSNGYGTLLEAGWSTQKAINGVNRKADSPLTAACYRGQLWLFYQPIDEKGIRACCGDYCVAKRK